MYKSEKIKALMSEYDALLQQQSVLENKLAEAGLEAEEVIYIGDYGNGRSLLLEDDYRGYSRGDWLSSSEDC